MKKRLKSPSWSSDDRSSSESERANAEVRQGKSATSPDNIDSGRKKIKFPLLFTKTAVAGTTTNPLLTENDRPSGKLSAKAEKAHKTVMVAGIPEEIGVGAKVMQKNLPAKSKYSWSRPSRSGEDDKVQGKVKDFYKTKLGKQKEDNIPPIAKEPRIKGSFHGAEQGRGRDYSRRRVRLSYDIQCRLNQAMTDSDRLKARAITKRSLVRISNKVPTDRCQSWSDSNPGISPRG